MEKLTVKAPNAKEERGGEGGESVMRSNEEVGKSKITSEFFHRSQKNPTH